MDNRLSLWYRLFEPLLGGNALLKPIVPAEMNPPLAPILVQDAQGLRGVEDFLRQTKNQASGLDLETNVVDTFYERRIRTIQLGNREVQYIIDLRKFAGSSAALVEAQANFGANAKSCFSDIIEVLRPYVCTQEWLKVGVNLSFEYEMLYWNLGLRLTGLYDVQMAERNLYSGLVPLSQSDVISLQGNVARYLGLDLEPWKDYQTSFNVEQEDLTQGQLEYCALDVRLPVAIRARQMTGDNTRAGLVKDKVLWPFQIDCDSIGPFADSSIVGIGIDEALWKKKIEWNEAANTQLVKALDRIFLPVVGSKHVTPEDLAAEHEAEVAWKMAPQKTPDEKAERAKLRVKFYEHRRDVAGRLKTVDSCEGEAAINYGSPTQLLAALRKMGYGPGKLPDTDDGSFKMLASDRKLDIKRALKERPDLHYPVIDLLRLKRSVDKELDTYGYAWISTYDEEVKSGAKGKKRRGNLHPVTRRIHPRFDPFGAETGRSACIKPNMQNLPKDAEFRRAFVARPGYKIITIDMSGAELRIIAEMSGDPVWLEAFSKGWDVHSICAELIYGKVWLDAAEDGCAFYEKHEKCNCREHKRLRDYVKALNFGLAYGKGPKALAEDLDITENDAKKLMRDYSVAFSVVIRCLENLSTEAQQKLAVRTLSGRRKRWKEPTFELAKQYLAKTDKIENPTVDQVRKKMASIYGAIGREGRNLPFQGTNADIIKRAMYLVWKRLPEFDAHIIIMVHDELVIEVREDHAQVCFEFVDQKIAEAGAEFLTKVTMTTEGHIDDCWRK